MNDCLLAPPIECRQWWCQAAGLFTVVVAATKEDARLLAIERITGKGRRHPYVHVRPATVADLEAFEQGITRSIQIVDRGEPIGATR